MKTSWIMMMQPSATMIKILVFRNYSVFDEPHFLKKLRKNLRVSLVINVCWVDIKFTLTICLTCTRCIRERQRPEGEGGLAARSGTEFTWSPQLRNLAEWDWVPIFLQNKYGRECRLGRTTRFWSVLSFPPSKHQEKVPMNFFNGIFGHQEGWCMNSLWETSLFVIRHPLKFSYL